ncbi:copia-type polyprotein [Tanacetum coccineum]
MNAMNTSVNKKINDDGSTGTIHLEQNFGASLAPTTQKDLNVGIPYLEITIRKQNVDSAKFSSTNGMESMLDHSPLLIRNMPFIFRKWSSNTNLSKEDLKSVLVWVKSHDIPINAFMNDREVEQEWKPPSVECVGYWS